MNRKRGLGSFFKRRETPHDVSAPERRFVESFDISSHAQETAREIASAGYDSHRPAIFLLGVMPRSGTVHVGNVIRLHPAVADYPNEIWEIPFLHGTNHLLEFQTQFFATYSMNDGKVGKDDFLPLFGSAFLRYLRRHIPEDQRLFLKEPRVHFLDYFFAHFPNEFPVLLMRDGRDVVSSTIKSWPEYSFDQVCFEWQEAAKSILRFIEFNQQRSQHFLYVRFEDILADPLPFIEALCDKAALDIADFPVDEIANLPVQGSSAMKRQGQVDWDPRKKPDNFDPRGRWKDWDPAQIRRFKEIAGETLIELGYEADSNW